MIEKETIDNALDYIEKLILNLGTQIFSSSYFFEAMDSQEFSAAFSLITELRIVRNRLDAFMEKYYDDNNDDLLNDCIGMMK